MSDYKNPFEPGGAFYNPRITDASKVIEPRIMPRWAEERQKANQHDEEIEWVLEIYSPMISEKFIEAKNTDDYYEMRRLTYWALQNNFNNNWTERVSFGFELPPDKPVAILRYNENAKYSGLRVYYTINKYVDNHYIGIMSRTKPLYFPRGNGKYFDAHYPVDIKLYEGNGKKATGDTYYGDDDFIGTFGESSLIVLGFGKGSGIMVGYMRGFGYCEYYYTMTGYGLSISLISSGTIKGKYNETRGKQTPDEMAGQGITKAQGGGSAGYTTWESINNNGNKTFEGTSYGLAAGYKGSEKLLPDLIENILNISVANFNTCTDLLFPLPKQQDKRNNIKKSWFKIS